MKNAFLIKYEIINLNLFKRSRGKKKERKRKEEKVKIYVYWKSVKLGSLEWV